MKTLKEKALEYLESCQVLRDKHSDINWYKDKDVLKALDMQQEEIGKLKKRVIKLEEENKDLREVADNDEGYG